MENLNGAAADSNIAASPLGLAENPANGDDSCERLGMTIGSVTNGYEGMVVYAAVQWIESTILGAFATSLAAIAVAFLGLGLLRGRLHAAVIIRVFIGCCILFGAPTIALGIMVAARGGQAGNGRQDFVAAPEAAPTSRPQDYDPYAGAVAPRF